MTKRLSDDDGCSIPFTARTGETEIWPDKLWFPQLVRFVWPVKGAMALTEYCSCPSRTAYNYTSGHSEPPASVLRDLQRGREGYRVCSAMFADVPWWLNVQSELAIAASARAFHKQLSEQIGR